MVKFESNSLNSMDLPYLRLETTPASTLFYAPLAFRVFGFVQQSTHRGKKDNRRFFAALEFWGS